MPVSRDAIPEWFLAVVTIGITLQIACMGVLINLQIKQSDRLTDHVVNHPNHAMCIAVALLEQTLKTHTHNSAKEIAIIPQGE